MNKTFSYVIFLAALGLLLFPLRSVPGCRYTVRDIGFVDLDSPPYTLYCYVTNDTPKDLVSTIKRIAYAALLDSNVVFKIVNIDDAQAERDSFRYIRELDIKSYPAAVLVSPKGGAISIPLGKERNYSKDALWDSLESAVSSPAREKILESVVKTYCTILLFDGVNGEENRKARAVVKEAIKRIGRDMAQMPKPINEPPRLIEIPHGNIGREAVLLWSIGAGGNTVEKPVVAVVYGRGRFLEPLLGGSEITRGNLLKILYVIGLSCECGLGRKRIFGTMLPIRWDSERQSEVIKYAGFDAENPSVKMEVAEILAVDKTACPIGSGRSADSGDILGGYSETSIGPAEDSSEDLAPALLQKMVSPKPESKTTSPGVSILLIPMCVAVVLVILSAAVGIYLFVRRAREG